MNRRRVIFFTSAVLLLAIIVGSATKLLEHYSIIERVPRYWQSILAYFIVITTIVYFVLHKITNQDPTEFVRAFLLSVVLKIMLSGVAIIILVKLYPAGANSNAVFYLCCYALFTFLEVSVLFIQKNKQ